MTAKYVNSPLKRASSERPLSDAKKDYHATTSRTPASGVAIQAEHFTTRVVPKPGPEAPG
jgi:hypothetical protein